MPRNIEIKARVDHPLVLRALVEGIAHEGPIELHQVDTFFGGGAGRLKLRELGGGSAELIFYQRPNDAGPKESRYLLTTVSDPDMTKQILGSSNGVLGEVKKRRLLFWVGQTRIHLDHVEGLGDFLELEVVLRDDQSTDEGAAIASCLMETLEIRNEQLVETAYFDLLEGSGI